MSAPFATAPQTRVALLTEAQRFVIKCGTQVLMGPEGQLLKPRLTQLVHEWATLHAQGKQVLIVTSGAVGLGQQVLKLPAPLELHQKQACASVGQSQLMEVYRQLFECHGLVTAQILVTARDIADRQSYLTLHKTLETLLGLGVIPIINENDAIANAELKEEAATQSFGDNDKLSAILASKLSADVLVMLTTVDGIYTDNPHVNQEAERLAIIEGFEALQSVSVSGKSTFGRGGMATKLEAARIAALSGVHAVVASGSEPQPMMRLFNPDVEGATVVLAKQPIRRRKRWLGFASGFSGVVIINAGAHRALVKRHASLLAAGVEGVKGDFQAKQVVSIQTPDGLEIGRGLSHYSAEQLLSIQGLQSHQLAQVLDWPEAPAEVIHCDDLVLYEESSGEGDESGLMEKDTLSDEF